MKANIWLLTVIRHTRRANIGGWSKPREVSGGDKRKRMKNPVGSKRPDETNRHRIYMAVISVIVCVIDVQF